MKRYHDQGNSYKGKHSIRAGLQFQRFSPLSSWPEAWQFADIHGAGGTKDLHLDFQAAAGDSKQSRGGSDSTLSLEIYGPKAHLNSDLFPPTRPYFLIVPSILKHESIGQANLFKLHFCIWKQGFKLLKLALI